MSKIVMDRILSHDFKYTNMIPVASLRIKASNTVSHLMVRSMASFSGSNMPKNNELDRFIVYNSTDNTILSKFKSIYQDHDIIIPGYNAEKIVQILVDPQTIYKITNLSFSGSSCINKVIETYTFNTHIYTNFFKNCPNIIEFPRCIGPTICDEIDTVYNLDFMFANNVLATKLPENFGNIFYNLYLYITASMNNIFMNTPNVKNNTNTATEIRAFDNLYNITVTPLGGNAMFFNSSFIPDSYIHLENVIILKNAFANIPVSWSNNYVSFNVQSAKEINSIFRESKAFKEISLYNLKSLINANNAFKNNITVTDVNFTNENGIITLDEYISVFSGCTNLTSVDNLLKLNNAEIVIDMFKNCSKLPNDQFYVCDFNNAKIASGVFEGCTLLNDNAVLSSDDNVLNMPKVEIMNNLFKDCSTFSYMSRQIDLGTTARNVCADGCFKGCTGLAYRPEILNSGSIVSAAEIYRDCKNITTIDTSILKNATNTSGAFMGCSKLTTAVPLPAAVIASCAYTDCDALNNATVNFTNAEYLASTFRNCGLLTENGITNAGTMNKAKDVSSMFEGCIGLTTVDSNVVDTNNAKTLVGLFKGCRNMSTVNLNLNSAENVDGIFYGCTMLEQANIEFNGDIAPALSFRGTKLSVDSLNSIISSLPDVTRYDKSKQGDYSNDILEGLTWVGVNNSFVVEHSYSNFYSTNVAVELTPGHYEILMPVGDESYGVCVSGLDDYDIINTFSYNGGYEISIPVDIQIPGSYKIIINSSGKHAIPQMRWVRPYFSIDIRNTPANEGFPYVSVTEAENKGWALIYDQSAIKPISDEDEHTTYSLRRPIEGNYIEGIQMTEMENDLWTTEVFNLDAGYYTLYSETNKNDRFKVYKVLPDGEYPIAVSYNNDYVLCFNVVDNFDVRIVYRNEADDLVLLRS